MLYNLNKKKNLCNFYFYRSYLEPISSYFYKSMLFLVIIPYKRGGWGTKKLIDAACLSGR